VSAIVFVVHPIIESGNASCGSETAEAACVDLVVGVKKSAEFVLELMERSQDRAAAE
jgi:hypothetical protein